MEKIRGTPSGTATIEYDMRVSGLRPGGRYMCQWHEWKLCLSRGGSSVGCRSSGHGARGKEPRVRFPPWAIFSEGERRRVDWPEPAPRGSWIIAELCKWKIDSVGSAAT